MLEIGTVLDGKWVILEFLGKGGMGEVYRAHQLNLKRDVAIKIVSREWLDTLDGDEGELENAISRFRREVKATAAIRHPNVVQIIDYGSTKLQVNGVETFLEYIAMEYIPGATLRFTMSEEGFEPDEELMSSWLRDYFFTVLEGVAAIHAAGMVHRDLKPENVLMDGTIPKIADFGLAASRCLAPITGSVDVKGTAAYMSPEQFVDLKRTDARADIYALGKILYEAAVGRMPPTTIPFKTVALDHPEKPLFKDLDEIMQKATAEKREDRFDSVVAFQSALKEALDRQETPRFPQIEASAFRMRSGHPMKWVWLGIFITLLALSAMTVWHIVGTPPPSPVQMAEPSVVNSKAPETVEETMPPRKVEPGPETASASADNLSKMLRGKDGAELYLVPGGTLTVPEAFGPRSGEAVDLPPFYMSETLVTNYQYVEFLNEMLSKIQVDHAVVRGEGKIWLLLGEVVEDYDPITFRDGKFHVTNPAHAACPVVRVTPYGASAYAAFFGRRLPTDLEWLQAIKEGTPKQEGSSKGAESFGADSPAAGMMERMHAQQPAPSKESGDAPPFPSPVMLYSADTLGIRGLNGNVDEWGIRKSMPASENEAETGEYVILGGQGKDANSTKGSALSAPIPRQPWEAFEEVGFRCVVTAPAPSTGEQ